MFISLMTTVPFGNVLIHSDIKHHLTQLKGAERSSTEGDCDGCLLSLV